MDVKTIYRPTPPEMLMWDDFHTSFTVTISDMLALLYQYEPGVRSITPTHVEREGVVLCTVTIEVETDAHEGTLIVSATSGEPMTNKNGVDANSWSKAETFATKKAIRMLGIGCDVDSVRGLRMPDGTYAVSAVAAQPTPYDERIDAATTAIEHNEIIDELRDGRDNIPNAAAIADRVLTHGKSLGLEWDNDNRAFKLDWNDGEQAGGEHAKETTDAQAQS